MNWTCPTADRLRDFLEGTVSDADADQIADHVEDCTSCDRIVSALENEQASVLREIRDGVRIESLLGEPEFQLLRNTVPFDPVETTDASEAQQRGETGKRLRDYRLVKKIGEGGMGTVYQAVHVHLAKHVALKILPADKLRSSQSVRRFRQEMRAVGKVNHVNVVSASDAGTIDGQHFLVMELVQGADLARIIHDRGPLSVADACETVRQAAIGLQHAHDNGLVHRDVKPSNIMLSLDGTVKLLDLGLAGLNNTDFEPAANVVVTDRLTSVGQIMGTLDYMAPEQITASPLVDGKADIYALGATLFQLLTGRTPCGDRSEGTPQRIEAVLQKPPMEIRTLRDDIPEELSALLRRMLAKNPQDRPQSARDVQISLERFTADADLVALAEACRTSLDIPSADVDVTEDVSLVVSRPEPDEQTAPQRRRSATVSALLLVLAASVVYLSFTIHGIVFQESGPRKNKEKPGEPPRSTEGQQSGPSANGGKKPATSVPLAPTAVAEETETTKELLGHGYTRDGEHILFQGKRIDREGAQDLKRLARLIRRELKLASDVDADSFKALSEEYTKDKKMVYYKWISPGRFWVVQLPEADPKTFESVAFNLAKDHQHVWWYGDVLDGLDPKTLEIVNEGFVWKDRHSVWYQHERYDRADPETFAHIGQAFYRDKNRVYWSLTPLDGADPKTFRSFGDNVPYGADRDSVYRGTQTLPKLDPATFGVVHQSVYKDQNGVYCNGVPVPGARSATTRKLADLNESLTALLTDGEKYFIFVALWNDVYQVEPKVDGLHVSREVWEGSTSPPGERLGIASARLTEQGWQDLSAPESKRWGENYYRQREAQTLTQFKKEFTTAWEMITGRKVTVGTSQEFVRIMNTPATGNYVSPVDDDYVLLQQYRRTQRKFDDFFRQWLALNPEIQAELDRGTPLDVAEIFGAEIFGAAESKLPADVLNRWRATSLTLAQNMFALQMRRLRPPMPESPVLREELIRQAAAMLSDEEIPAGKDAEAVIDPKIDQRRLHFPEFLWLTPADEKKVQAGQEVNDPVARVKKATAVLKEAEVDPSRLAQQLVKKYERDELTAVQKELLAQLLTTESRAAQANP